MREPFAHLRRPRKVPGDPRKGEFQGSASLAVEGVRFRQNLSGSLRMPASSETEQAANARERQAPRGARRSDAGEDIGARWVCPYVESSLQKSVGGNGLKKRPFPTFCLTARE